MPRAQFSCDPLTPYHLVARTNGREAFGLPLEVIWSIFTDQLFFLHHAYGVRLHAFVLMNNHFHLLATFPNSNLSAAMCAFMGNTSKVIGFELGSKNHLWGSRVFRSRLGSYHYFLNAYKYVYLNPVRARVCRLVEEYPFSSLSGLVGLNRIGFPLAEDALLFDDSEETMRWLNVMPSLENIEAMRLALSWEDFKLPKFGSNRTPHALETLLL